MCNVCTDCVIYVLPLIQDPSVAAPAIAAPANDAPVVDIKNVALSEPPSYKLGDKLATRQVNSQGWTGFKLYFLIFDTITGLRKCHPETGQVSSASGGPGRRHEKLNLLSENEGGTA